MSIFCDAITWGYKDGERDYIPCTDVRGVRRYRLDGLLLSVVVSLCCSHRNHFESKRSNVSITQSGPP